VLFDSPIAIGLWLAAALSLVLPLVVPRLMRHWTNRGSTSHNAG